MFVVALVHGVFLSDPVSRTGRHEPDAQPAQQHTYSLGSGVSVRAARLAALIILFLMAATSHDFWLHNLTPGVWKRLHMAVCHGIRIRRGARLLCGALQSENQSDSKCGHVGNWCSRACTLHLLAGLRERDHVEQVVDEFTEVCALESIPDQRKSHHDWPERIAVFRQGTKVSALSNVCRHQNGPLGEGRIVDGCVTCPWHGYQYHPDTGVSPPPSWRQGCGVPGEGFGRKSMGAGMSEMNDDFYVGYLPTAAPAIRHNMRWAVAVLGGLCSNPGGTLVFAQGPFADSRFEYGQYRDYSGELVEWPYPMLLSQDVRLLAGGPWQIRRR